MDSWVDEAARRWLAGEKIADLVNRFHVSKSRLVDVLRDRLGGEQRLLLREVRQRQYITRYKTQAIALKEQGLNYSEIGRRLGISRYRVQFLLEAVGHGGQHKAKPIPCARCECIGYNLARRLKEETFYLEAYDIWVCQICRQKIEREGERALPKMRKCLWCGEPFLSADAGNRRCKVCRQNALHKEYDSHRRSGDTLGEEE